MAIVATMLNFHIGSCLPSIYYKIVNVYDGIIIKRKLNNYAQYIIHLATHKPAGMRLYYSNKLCLQTQSRGAFSVRLQAS